MSAISTAVGAKAPNNQTDVAIVQRLLNLRAAAIGTPPLRTDGVCDATTIAAIRNFELCIVGLRRASGRVDPAGRVSSWLMEDGAAALARDKRRAEAAKARLSGSDWFHANQASIPQSNEVRELLPAFSVQVAAFLEALDSAGAHVRIATTYRSRARGHVMHYAWGIADGSIAIAEVPEIQGVDIIWDHGDADASKAAAKAMVALFHMKAQASLTSNHYDREAIDMTIGWDHPITIIDGKGAAVLLDKPRSGANNPDLHAVGASYGVFKLTRKYDPPHWSIDGA